MFPLRFALWENLLFVGMCVSVHDNCERQPPCQGVPLGSNKGCHICKIGESFRVSLTHNFNNTLLKHIGSVNLSAESNLPISFILKIGAFISCVTDLQTAFRRGGGGGVQVQKEALCFKIEGQTYKEEVINTSFN